MKHSKPEAPEETNAAGNPLPRNWISVIAIICAVKRFLSSQP